MSWTFAKKITEDRDDSRRRLWLDPTDVYIRPIECEEKRGRKKDDTYMKRRSALRLPESHAAFANDVNDARQTVVRPPGCWGLPKVFFDVVGNFKKLQGSTRKLHLSIPIPTSWWTANCAFFRSPQTLPPANCLSHLIPAQTRFSTFRQLIVLYLSLIGSYSHPCPAS